MINNHPSPPSCLEAGKHSTAEMPRAATCPMPVDYYAGAKMPTADPFAVKQRHLYKRPRSHQAPNVVYNLFRSDLKLARRWPLRQVTDWCRERALYLPLSFEASRRRSGLTTPIRQASDAITEYLRGSWSPFSFNGGFS